MARVNTLARLSCRFSPSRLLRSTQYSTPLVAGEPSAKKTKNNWIPSIFSAHIKPHRVTRVVRASKAGVALHAGAVHLALAAVPRDVPAFENITTDPAIAGGGTVMPCCRGGGGGWREVRVIYIDRGYPIKREKRHRTVIHKQMKLNPRYPPPPATRAPFPLSPRRAWRNSDPGPDFANQTGALPAGFFAGMRCPRSNDHTARTLMIFISPVYALYVPRTNRDCGAPMEPRPAGEQGARQLLIHTGTTGYSYKSNQKQGGARKQVVWQRTTYMRSPETGKTSEVRRGMQVHTGIIKSNKQWFHCLHTVSRGRRPCSSKRKQAKGDSG